MPTRALRSSPAALFIFAGLLALAACGSSGIHVCPLAGSGCCGAASDACIAPQYIYATGLNGQVDVFPIVNGTGMPGSPTSTPGPAPTLGMAALNNQFLYVSNPQATLGGSSSIDGWSIDPSTGALKTIPASPFSLGPLSYAGGLATNTAAQIVYVGDAGRIDALKADATGALSPILGSPFPAGINLYLTTDPQTRFLFASEDTPPGNVIAFTIDATTGALNAVPGSPFPTISGNVGNTHPGAIVVDSSGSFVYTALMTTNQIAAFSITASSGALNPVPGSPFTAGNTPLALATVNNFLYVSNALDGTISGYSINSTTGMLTPLANSPFPIHAGALVASPFGGFLYTTGPGGLLTLSINPQTGALTQAGSPVPYSGATVLAFVE